MPVNYIDLSNVNFWIVNLKPFGDQETKSEMSNYQQKWIKESVFGMGWRVNGFETGVKLKDFKEQYIASCKNAHVGSYEQACESFNQIKTGDYVLMKLLDAKFYFGKVKEEARWYNGDKISWACEVEEWVTYEHDYELPSEILGRLMGRHQPTITRVSKYKHRLLMLKAFELKKYGKSIVPGIQISVDNFANTLTPERLEDLVALYIYKKHPDYILLPSSCKVSRPMYEFDFVKNGSLPITCQVKNEAEISLDYYINEKSYKKIYLFSNRWSNSKISTLKERCLNTCVEIITREDLFALLTGKDKLIDFSNVYYSFDYRAIDVEKAKCILEENGYSVSNKKSRIHNNEVVNINSEWINFCKYGIWYSAEFNVLINEWQKDNQVIEKIQTVIEKVLG